MMLKLIKNRKLRASATSASIASAGVPDSGFAFINNSHGASAAIAELSTRLDEALERIDLDGKLKWKFRRQSIAEVELSLQRQAIRTTNCVTIWTNSMRKRPNMSIRALTNLDADPGFGK
jgi:hypothetical protein